MRSKIAGTTKRLGFKRLAAMGMAGALLGGMTLTPPAAAANSRDEERMRQERVVDRGEVENLQRWVSSGHADWCKDARLVAAEELWRLAPDYSGDGFQLNAVKADGIAGGGNRMAFEWAPPDGRAIFRVTVERFEWLLPIAKKADGIVWVPTSTEIRSHE